ncbi:MAG: hypothetical protein WC058_06040 [Phycisphaeraceae bacterium]
MTGDDDLFLFFTSGGVQPQSAWYSAMLAGISIGRHKIAATPSIDARG